MISYIWHQKHKWQKKKINGTASKLKTFFFTSKDIIKKVKRQPTELENIFASYISDKRLEFRICEELLQLNNKQLKFKNRQRCDKHVPKEMYKCPISTKKDQHHASWGKCNEDTTSHSLGWLESKRQTRTFVYQNVETLETSYIVAGIVN